MEPDDDQKGMLKDGSSSKFKYMQVYPAFNLLSAVLCVQTHRQHMDVEIMLKWMDDHDNRIRWP